MTTVLILERLCYNDVSLCLVVPCCVLGCQVGGCGWARGKVGRRAAHGGGHRAAPHEPRWRLWQRRCGGVALRVVRDTLRTPCGTREKKAPGSSFFIFVTYYGMAGTSATWKTGASSRTRRRADRSPPPPPLPPLPLRPRQRRPPRAVATARTVRPLAPPTALAASYPAPTAKTRRRVRRWRRPRRRLTRPSEPGRRASTLGSTPSQTPPGRCARVRVVVEQCTGEAQRAALHHPGLTPPPPETFGICFGEYKSQF